MTDGPEIPGARHVTDDEDPTTTDTKTRTYTARKKTYEEEERGARRRLLGKGGLIPRFHCRLSTL
jgi:hypothetical protein